MAQEKAELKGDHVNKDCNDFVNIEFSAVPQYSSLLPRPAVFLGSLTEHMT